MHHLHRTIIVFFLFLILPAMGYAAWRSDGTLKVAVMDIVSRIEGERIDAVTITEMLQARLVEKQAFQIVERSMLNKILEEKKLRMLGLTDVDASSIGAMAGADKIVTGSISRMADRYVVLVKGIDTRTAVVELSEQEMTTSARDLPAAVQDIADRLVRKAKGEAAGITKAPAPREIVLLEEHFENNVNGWPIGDWDAASATLKDRQYVIRMKTQYPIFYTKIDVLIDPESDLSIEASVAKLKGAHEDSSYYGIIVGRDFSNMYEFLVHPNGRVMVRAQRNGETTFIQPSAMSPHTRRGNASNTLRIDRENGAYKFYLNGQMVSMDRPREQFPASLLIGFEVWQTAGEKLVIAGKQFSVRQKVPAANQ